MTTCHDNENDQIKPHNRELSAIKKLASHSVEY